VDAAGLGAFLLDILEAAIDHRVERIKLEFLAAWPVVAATARSTTPLTASIATIAAPRSAVATLTLTARAALAVAPALTFAAGAGLALSFRTLAAVARRSRPAIAARGPGAAGTYLALAFGRGSGVVAGAAQLRRPAPPAASRPRR